jgi:YHS domain-containing protein
MKRNLLLTACALGVLAFSTKLAVADTAAASGCAGMPGCCLTTPVTDTNTNAVPDQLTTCPVSGDKLGEMGKPYVLVYKGQEVKLCCSGCKKDFEKDPEKYIKLIRAADKK